MRKIIAGVFFSLFVFAVYGKEYQGTVVSLDISTYTEGTDEAFYGYIDRVPRLGQILQPPVFDAEGQIKSLKDGNIVLSMNKRYFLANYYQEGAALENDIVQIKLTEILLKRYQMLYRTNAGSQEQYENMMSQFNNDYLNYESDLAAQAYQRGYVSSATNYAPYEGFVSNVYVIEGEATWQNILETTQLNPIGISLKMSREEAKKIKSTNKVKVIPVNCSNSQGIYTKNTILTNDGLMFITDNFPILNKTETIPDDDLEVYRNCMPVINFNIDSEELALAVHMDCLREDKDGFYVWKALGQKTLSPDHGIDPKFKIKKIYVKPSGLHRAIAGYDKYAELSDSGGLELYDITLINPSENLKDEQEIYFPDQRYLLMPGDSVKVIIENIL